MEEGLGAQGERSGELTLTCGKRGITCSSGYHPLSILLVQLSNFQNELKLLPHPSCAEYDNPNGTWAGESGTQIWGYWVTVKPEEGTGKFPVAAPTLSLPGT